MPMQEGPQISWRDLTTFQSCTEGARAYSCDIFESRRPSTIAMTVLVSDAVSGVGQQQRFVLQDTVLECQDR